MLSFISLAMRGDWIDRNNKSTTKTKQQTINQVV